MKAESLKEGAELKPNHGWARGKKILGKYSEDCQRGMNTMPKRIWTLVSRPWEANGET